MSVQGDIEAALVSIVETAITGLTGFTGPRSQNEIEGVARSAQVFMVSGEAERIDHGQLEWTETYALVVAWQHRLERATRLTEWEAVTTAIAADQYLGGSIASIADAYVKTVDWGEAVDSGFATMTSTVEVVRLD